MGGLPVIEQWSGGPAAEMEFTDGGELRLAALRLDAWRFVEFPPAWSGDESLPTTLQKDLDLLAVRVRQGLEAWRKSLPLLADALHGPLH